MHAFLDSRPVQQLLTLHLPRFEELPTLDLYMDQVISVTDQVLRPLYPGPDDPILTPTMIHNYVKQHLVEAPVRKRYTRTHLAALLLVALLKQVFSMAEIRWLLELNGRDCDGETYNTFCGQLEDALQYAFTGQSHPAAEGAESPLRAAALSLAHRIYVDKYLAFTRLQSANIRHAEAEEAVPCL